MVPLQEPGATMHHDDVRRRPRPRRLLLLLLLLLLLSNVQPKQVSHGAPAARLGSLSAFAGVGQSGRPLALPLPESALHGPPCSRPLVRAAFCTRPVRSSRLHHNMTSDSSEVLGRGASPRKPDRAWSSCDSGSECGILLRNPCGNP